ncbi:hypothetical protein EJ06DRAFT_534198 [Trichodelitschia bisporula]|uniref:C2H2-type domain-containing protein n=1 Tax=Trichodelitschia bisporula TaxID=703511 RepID=A0A6G1HKP5_9PEZI|nr:hypothetical protein EJ06DRAFT_534198 [Trichodelitschia bisporula]
MSSDQSELNDMTAWQAWWDCEAELAFFQEEMLRLAPPSASTEGTQKGSEEPAGETKVDSEEHLGVVLKTGRLQCSHTECLQRSFSRLADLRRHHLSSHVKEPLWCSADGCPRSKASDRPFFRRDKLMEHELKMHGKVSSVGN